MPLAKAWERVPAGLRNLLEPFLWVRIQTNFRSPVYTLSRKQALLSNWIRNFLLAHPDNPVCVLDCTGQLKDPNRALIACVEFMRHCNGASTFATQEWIPGQPPPMCIYAPGTSIRPTKPLQTPMWRPPLCFRDPQSNTEDVLRALFFRVPALPRGRGSTEQEVDEWRVAFYLQHMQHEGFMRHLCDLLALARALRIDDLAYDVSMLVGALMRHQDTHTLRRMFT